MQRSNVATCCAVHSISGMSASGSALAIHFKILAPRTRSIEGEQIVASRHAQPGAFESLVRRHQTAVYNFCWRMLGQADDAADVAQDVFVRLYSHLDQIDADEPLAPWLFRVARNRCIDLI